MNLNEYINQLYKVTLFAFFAGIVVDPTSVGEWKAQMDIGYDMIWSSSDSYALSEYLMDYTCTGE